MVKSCQEVFVILKEGRLRRLTEGSHPISEFRRRFFSRLSRDQDDSDLSLTLRTVKRSPPANLNPFDYTMTFWAFFVVSAVNF